MLELQAREKAALLKERGKDARAERLPWDSNFWVVRLYKNNKPDDCVYFI